jgi:hypothetical protein
MSKAELRQKLLVLFAPVHVEGYLSRFPDHHRFPPTATGDFVDYINSLPAPGRLPEEDYDYP